MNQRVTIVLNKASADPFSQLVPLWKRALDITLIVAAAPVVVPVMALIALGIVVVSPGPIFFNQDRIGLSGRRFRCWKFRSMKIGAPASTHQAHTLRLMQAGEPWAKMDKGDPRVIPLGAGLRATGLDELPQLFNVLRGEMSLVGPRPCTPYEFEHYSDYQKGRLNGLPGLTGLWQVSGKGKTTFSEMIDLDRRYLEQRSFGQDLRIIMLTFPALVRQLMESTQAKKSPPVEETEVDLKRVG